MIMNEDGGTFYRACCFQAKERGAWMASLSCGFDLVSLAMAGREQWSQKGSLRDLLTTESTFAMYSRSPENEL